MGVLVFFGGLLVGLLASVAALFFALFHIRLFTARSGVATRSSGELLRAKLAADATAGRRASSFALHPIRSLLDAYFPGDEAGFDEAVSSDAAAAAAAAVPDMSRFLRTADAEAAGAASPSLRAADDAWASEIEANSVRLSVAVESYLQHALAATAPDHAIADDDAAAAGDASAGANAGADVPGGESVVWLNLLLRRALEYALGLGVELDAQAVSAAAAAAEAAGPGTAAALPAGAAAAAAGPSPAVAVGSPVSPQTAAARVLAAEKAKAAATKAKAGSSSAPAGAAATLAASIASGTKPSAGAAARSPTAGSSAAAAAASARRPVPFDAGSSVLLQLVNAALARAPLPPVLGPTRVETLYPGVITPLVHRVQVLSAEPGEPVVFEVEATYTGDSVVEVATSVKIDAFGIENLASMPVQPPTVRFDIASALGYYLQLVNTPHIHSLLHRLITGALDKAVVAPNIVSIPLLRGVLTSLATAALGTFGLQPPAAHQRTVFPAADGAPAFAGIEPPAAAPAEEEEEDVGAGAGAGARPLLRERAGAASDDAAGAAGGVGQFKTPRRGFPYASGVDTGVDASSKRASGTSAEAGEDYKEGRGAAAK